MAAQEQNTTNRPTGVISQETSDNANSFINILQETLEIVEDIITYLSDEQYLELCNNLLKLKKINDNNNGDRNATIRALQQRINNTEVVTTQIRYTNTTIRSPTAHLTDMQKLNLKDNKKRHIYSRCEKCDSIIQTKSMGIHQDSDKCKRITRSKSIAVDFKRKNTEQPFKLLDKIDIAKLKKRGDILNNN